jgi:hypothetical protein
MDQAGDQLTSQNGLTVYYEVPLDDHWNDNLTAAIAAIAENNRQIGHRNGFKLRCGGVVASAFPSSEQIAHALILCRDHDVPLKATAGLHHPIRHYNESVQTKMHGFINVFAAGILADVHQLSIDQTTAIINDEESGHFSFTESHFNWKNISATADQIASIRDARLIAYGSCSFDEPRDDLRALGWL